MNKQNINDFILDKLGFYPSNFKLPAICKISRFDDTSKKKGNGNCWAFNIDDNLMSIGSWSTGEKHTYCMNKDYESYTPDMKKIAKIRVNNAIKQIDIETAKRHLEISRKLIQWLPSLENANPKHEYLIKKRIKPQGSIKQYNSSLVIPIYSSSTGELQSAQFISKDGKKKFVTGGKIKGGCLPINKPLLEDEYDRTIIICEGYATACSVYDLILSLDNENYKLSDNTLVVCAFNCFNIVDVTENLRKKYKEAEIKIFADNDISGKGLEYANIAATKVNDVSIHIPPLTDEQKKQGLSDWNDYLNIGL